MENIYQSDGDLSDSTNDLTLEPDSKSLVEDYTLTNNLEAPSPDCTIHSTELEPLVQETSSLWNSASEYQTKEIGSDSLISELQPETPHIEHHQEISFGSAGPCWWCHGSGVVWSGGRNVPCSHCGGSGIGPT